MNRLLRILAFCAQRHGIHRRFHLQLPLCLSPPPASAPGLQFPLRIRHRNPPCPWLNNFSRASRTSYCLSQLRPLKTQNLRLRGTKASWLMPRPVSKLLSTRLRCLFRNRHARPPPSPPPPRRPPVETISTSPVTYRLLQCHHPRHRPCRPPLMKRWSRHGSRTLKKLFHRILPRHSLRLRCRRL